MSQRGAEDDGPPALPSDAATLYAFFSELIYADQPLADVLAGVSVLARQALNEAWEASLTLIVGRRVWTAVDSGPLALHLDQFQYNSGSGPALDAARSGTTVGLAMAGPDQPYPDFRLAARGQGVTHSISVGLLTGDQVRGAMNLYSSTGRPFSEDSDRIVRSFAFCAGIVLAHVERSRLAADRAAQIEAALQSRSLIEQAKGVLMARYRCTGDEAFSMLIELARRRQVTLEVVVEAIVNRGA